MFHFLSAAAKGVYLRSDGPVVPVPDLVQFYVDTH